MKNKFDAFLVTKPESIRYLSGFSGEGVLLLKKDKQVLITDYRYLLRARAESKRGFRISLALPQENFEDIFRKALKTLRIKKLGFESAHLTIANLKSLQKKSRGLKVKFIPTENEIEGKRRIKSLAEIKQIKKSCDLAVRIIRETIKNLRVGKSELEVSAEIRNLASRLGAEKLAFTPVVAFGPNSACPHAKPSKRKLKKGDVVLIDLGVNLNGYCSDITRTFFTAEPTEKQREIYSAVLRVQETAIAEIKSGKKAQKISNDSVDLFKNPPQSPFRKGGSVPDKSGTQGDLSKFFTHSLGHGVGLEVHEAPNLSIKSKDHLKTGNVVTVEPGIYLAGKFGIRIEDTIVVKKSGCDILTKFPKKLTLLKL